MVVIAPTTVSFLAAIAFPWTRPPEVPAALANVVAACGATALAATAGWGVPVHLKLDRIGQDDATIDTLLTGNLVRSIAFTVGTAALAWSVAGVIRRSQERPARPG